MPTNAWVSKRGDKLYGSLLCLIGLLTFFSTPGWSEDAAGYELLREFAERKEWLCYQNPKECASEEGERAEWLPWQVADTFTRVFEFLLEPTDEFHRLIQVGDGGGAETFSH